MRLLIQRVKSASVTIDKAIVGNIAQGLLVFVGICPQDSEDDIEYLSSKLVNLRVFDDKNGVMNLSLLDTNYEVLIISQFTLLAKTQKGNRPSYINAAKPEFSEPMYKIFCDSVGKKIGKEVETGVFGADMLVSLQNHGPVTIWIDSKDK